MGVAFAQSDIHQHAQELYEHAAVLNPEHPQLWNNWLYSVIAQGKLNEAKKKLEKYIQEDAYVGTLSLKQTLNPSGLLCVIVSLVEELALHL